MAEHSVEVNIVVQVPGGKRVERRIVVSGERVDEALQSDLKELGRDTVSAAYEELDAQLRQEMPESWRNLGEEEREDLMVHGSFHLSFI